jgi:metal-responsive CopG/Arc/MetJ family transcriptional regulator
MKDRKLPDHGRSANASYDERVTIRTREEFLKEVDRLVEEEVYSNRSEALRELAEEGLSELDFEGV